MQVVLQLPGCLRCGPVSFGNEQACARVIMQECAATAPTACFQAAVRRCARQAQPSSAGSGALGCVLPAPAALTRSCMCKQI